MAEWNYLDKNEPFLHVFPFDKYHHVSSDPVPHLSMEYGFLPYLREAP